MHGLENVKKKKGSLYSITDMELLLKMQSPLGSPLFLLRSRANKQEI
jgi:hypothetical protein